MLPRRHRLTAPHDYRAVMRGRAPSDGRRRSRAGTSLLVVHISLPDAADYSPAALQSCPRVGFAVSRGVGNSVVRHQVLRRLRVQMGQRLGQFPAGSDVVVRALSPAAVASSQQLGEAVDSALAKVLRVTA